MLEFRTVARSHVGLVRSGNEDSGFVGPRLVVVADGMGGAAAGEVASRLATHAVVEAFAEALAAQGAPALGEVLADGVAGGAEQIAAEVTADPGRAGMGTTLTALATDGTTVALAHLGDSRAYLLRTETLQQVTQDHTLVQAMVEAGRLSPAQARRSAHRHIVLRSLGGGGESEPDLVDLDLVAGDRLLVCSDGLSDLVADGDLAVILAVPDPERAADLLLAAALDAGGTDNVTCLVVDLVDLVSGTDGTGGPGQGQASLSGTYLGAAAAVPEPFNR